MGKEILKLVPAFKDYIWGGRRLIEEYGFKCEMDKISEAWVLSSHKDGISGIEGRKENFLQYISESKENILGNNCKRFTSFPILTKLIDAKDKLSIQVHPDNIYAIKNENQYGKTELWYIVDADKDAFIYYGLNRDITKEELEERIKNDTITEVLNKVYVKKDEAFLIEAGTIHAIGSGVLIAEIQQNSNVTYRVSDYGRVDANGNKRELHINKAVDVINRKMLEVKPLKEKTLCSCEYFKVDVIELNEEKTIFVDEDSFANVLVIKGKGQIENMNFKAGDSFFIPANTKDVLIKGSGKLLITKVPKLSNPYAIGVDIGGTSAKIGIVRDDYKIIDKTNVPTRNKSIEQIVDDIVESVIDLLTRNNLKIEQCIGLGVGVPGIVDRKKGKVIYSNNIRMEDVNLKQLFMRQIPLNVYILNDADSAALGEGASGAAKQYNNYVMITIGTGIGGGIVINNELFSGGIIGGVEIGHTILEVNGNLCTCGRKGCFEAYASATALRNKTKDIFGKEIEPLELFEMAKGRDNKAKEIIDNYIMYLGEGIINVANTFRPEAIILGGGISKQGDRLINPIKKMMENEIFGCEYGEVPKLLIAKLGNDAGIIGSASVAMKNK